MRRAFAWPIRTGIVACLAVAGCSQALPPPSSPPLASASADHSEPAASPRPTPVATPIASAAPQLDGSALGEAVTLEAIETDLAAFQRIADMAGGTRATRTPGYTASLRYVTERLVAAGYAPELVPFSIEGRSGTNLVADRGGTGDAILVIGAHLDSVPAGPGINDNGSAVAGLLALADALARLPAPGATIRFAFWDAEEGGPFGSTAYVASLASTDRDAIAGYLNLDMIGSPNAVRFVYEEAGAAPGSAAITAALVDAFEASDLPWDPVDLEGDSDHGPFTAAGIPTGGIFSGGIEPVTEAQAQRHGAIAGVPADACSHRACDTLDNVDAGTVLELTRVVARAIVELAGPS